MRIMLDPLVVEVGRQTFIGLAVISVAMRCKQAHFAIIYLSGHFYHTFAWSRLCRRDWRCFRLASICHLSGSVNAFLADAANIRREADGLASY